MDIRLSGERVRCEATIAISKLQRGLKYLDNEEELEKIDARKY